MRNYAHFSQGRRSLSSKNFSYFDLTFKKYALRSNFTQESDYPKEPYDLDDVAEQRGLRAGQQRGAKQIFVNGGGCSDESILEQWTRQDLAVSREKRNQASISYDDDVVVLYFCCSNRLSRIDACRRYSGCK